MSRRRQADKRPQLPDAKFGDFVIAKFISTVMMHDKKGVAETIVYGALEKISKKAGADALKTFHDALENIKPTVEVRSRRVGGATYQVPVEVRTERRQALAFRWLVQYARDRNESAMIARLSAELLDASANRGGAVKKREDTHRMAEANRAFSHYRW